MKTNAALELAIVALLVACAALGVVYLQPAPAAPPASPFNVNATTGTTHLSGGLAIGGNLATTGTDTTTGIATHAGQTIFSAQTIIPADNKPITPTTTFALLNGAGNTTNTLPACVTNGQILFATNIATYTVTIADSGNALLAAQVVLGQYDTLALVCVSTKWAQIATADN